MMKFRFALVFGILMICGAFTAISVRPASAADPTTPGNKRPIAGDTAGTAPSLDATQKDQVNTSSPEQEGAPDAKTSNEGTAGSHEVRTLKEHEAAVAGVAFSPDGKSIVSCAKDLITVWDVSSGDKIQTVRGHKGNVLSVVFSPDGKRIVSGGEDKTVRVWDVADGREVDSLRGHGSRVISVAVTPNGEIISGSWDGTVKAWSARGGSGSVLQRHAGHILSVAVIGGGYEKQLGSGGEDKILSVSRWVDAPKRSKQWVTGVIKHTNSVGSVAFSPDGTRIASGTDNLIKVWDAKMGSELNTLKGDTKDVSCLAFTPDGKRIVSGSDDGTVNLWDASSGQLIGTLKGHTAKVNCVVCSPDGKRIASGSRDKTVKLWDVAGGQEVPASTDQKRPTAQKQPGKS